MVLSCCLVWVDGLHFISSWASHFFHLLTSFLLLLFFKRRGRSLGRVNHVYVTVARAVLVLMKAAWPTQNTAFLSANALQAKMSECRGNNQDLKQRLASRNTSAMLSPFLDYTPCICVCTRSLDCVFNLHLRVDSCYSSPADNVSAVLLSVVLHLITVQPSGPLLPQQGAVWLTPIMHIQSLRQRRLSAFTQILLFQ